MQIMQKTPKIYPIIRNYTSNEYYGLIPIIKKNYKKLAKAKPKKITE